MKTEIDMNAVRKALQLSAEDMHEVHLIRHYAPSVKVDRAIIGYTLSFDRDAEFTVTHLAALAVAFGTHSIRVSYIASEEDDCDGTEHVPSELNVEIDPDA